MTNDLIPADIRYLENNAQRLPLILILDASYSMEDQPIAALNEGLKILASDLKDDPTARNRVEILCIQCSDDEPSIISEWKDAAEFEPPFLEASGATPLGASLELALDRLQQEKDDLDRNGVTRNVAWLMVISDGAPTDIDIWIKATKRCRKEIEKDRVEVFPIGVEQADLSMLSQCSKRPAVKLKGLEFRELFLWLSANSKKASKRTPGGREQMSTIKAWADVQA